MQNFIITLIIGALVGYIFFKLKVPGGMMVGAIIGVSLFNIFTSLAYIPVEGKVVAQIIAGAYIGVGLEKGDIIRLRRIFKPMVTILIALLILNISVGFIIYYISPMDLVTSLMCAIPGGIELMAARSHLLLAARAAGIYALDTVYSDVNNKEGFLDEVRLIKQMGFDGKSVIHPKQIGLVHKEFEPTEKEIKHSVKVLYAIKEAEKQGLGVITVDGKMVDEPIVVRARRIIELAKATGVYKDGDLID